MRLSLLLLLSLILFTFAGAKENSTANPFEKWKTCPKSRTSLKTQLQELDSVGDDFKSKSEKEKLDLLDDKSWRSSYIRHISPFILPEHVEVAFAKSCWVHYESMVRAAKSEAWKDVNTSAADWNSCLSATYDKTPAELQNIIKCVQVALGHK